MKAREVNFDGLVGLTHHYAGLSFGNEYEVRIRVIPLRSIADEWPDFS
jgi:succinylarginine dihydrolase